MGTINFRVCHKVGIANPSLVRDIIPEWEQNEGGFNSYYNTMGKILLGVLAQVNVKSTLDHENQP